MIDDEREVHEVGHRCHMLTIVNVMYMRGRGVFLKNRSMDNLYLNRMNSWQGVVKKEKEVDIYVVAFMGCAIPFNDIGGVASLFQ